MEVVKLFRELVKLPVLAIRTALVAPKMSLASVETISRFSKVTIALDSPFAISYELFRHLKPQSPCSFLKYLSRVFHS